MPGLDLPIFMAIAIGALTGVLVIVARWEVGVYIIAALFPYEGMLGGGGNLSGIKVVVTIVLLSTVIRLPFDDTAGRRVVQIFRDPVVVCFSGFVAWSFLSVTWASFPGEAVGRSVTFFGDLVLLALIALLDISGTVRAWRLFVWSAALSVPVAVVLTLTGVIGGAGGRLTLAGLNADAYSPILLIAAWACLVALQFKSRVIKPLLVVVLLAGALMTQTRTGLVAFVVGGAIAVAIAPRQARSYVFRRFAAMALVGCIAAAGVAAVAPSYARQSIARLGTAVDVEGPSALTGRKSLWLGALRMWQSDPLLGAGAGNYAQLSLRYSSYAAQLWQRRAEHSAAHNMYLSTLAELGLPGAALFVAVLVLVLFRLRKLAETMPFASGLLVAYCVYLTAGLALNWSYLKLFYFLAGTALALQASMPKLETEGRRLESPGIDSVA